MSLASAYQPVAMAFGHSNSHSFNCLDMLLSS